MCHMISRYSNGIRLYTATLRVKNTDIYRCYREIEENGM